METAATRQAPWSYPTILGEAMETSASSEARSAPLPYPTAKLTGQPADLQSLRGVAMVGRLILAYRPCDL